MGSIEVLGSSENRDGLHRARPSKFAVVIERVFGAFLALVLLLVVVLPPFLEYSRKRDYAVMDFAYLPLAVLVGVGAAYAARVLWRRFGGRLSDPRAFAIFLVVGTVALVALQAVIVKGAWFVTDWDLLKVADFDSINDSYFSRYPNQLFITGLFRRIAGLGVALGFHRKYLLVTCVGCLCVAYSVLMTGVVARRLGGFAAGYCAFLLAFVFLGLSPWILVPYSDTYAMPFPITVLALYVFMKRREVAWPLMLFVTVVGYQVKPTVVFALAAVVVVGLFELPGLFRSLRQEGEARKRGLYLLRGVACVAACVLAAVLALALAGQVKDFGANVDDEQSFGVAHYLMMGMDTESPTMGTWDGDDVKFSKSFSTRAEREAADLERFGERIRNAGAGGVALLLARKTLSNFADGAFSWEGEGKFYKNVKGKNELIKAIYGISQEDTMGAANNLFAVPSQIMWLMVLVGCAACCFFSPGRKEFAAMCLMLLFLAGFLTIFECRARYLLLYTPVFVALATCGWKVAHVRMLRRLRD